MSPNYVQWVHWGEESARERAPCVTFYETPVAMPSRCDLKALSRGAVHGIFEIPALARPILAGRGTFPGGIFLFWAAWSGCRLLYFHLFLLAAPELPKTYFWATFHISVKRTF